MRDWKLVCGINKDEAEQMSDGSFLRRIVGKPGAGLGKPGVGLVKPGVDLGQPGVERRSKKPFVQAEPQSFLQRLNLACLSILRFAWRCTKLFAFFSVCFWIGFQPCVMMSMFEFIPLKYPDGKYERRTVSGITAQDVYFLTSDGKKLQAWYFDVPNARKTILVHHGHGGNVTYYLDIISIFLQLDCSVFLYDYEGYGRSEGRPSNERVIADGQAAYDFCARHLQIPANRIIHCGVSLGTAVACNVCLTRPGCALILLAPYTS